MKAITAGVLLGLLLACNAQARLGETKKQIVERYGEEISELPKLLDYSGKGHWGTFFRFNGYVISVMLDRDRCVREAYSRCDGQAIGEAEMKMLMDLNASGNKWDRLDDRNLPDTDSPEWLRADDRARAFYNKIYKVFVISRFVPRQSQSRTGAALKGF